MDPGRRSPTVLKASRSSLAPNVHNSPARLLAGNVAAAGLSTQPRSDIRQAEVVDRGVFGGNAGVLRLVCDTAALHPWDAPGRDVPIQVFTIPKEIWLTPKCSSLPFPALTTFVSYCKLKAVKAGG